MGKQGLASGAEAARNIDQRIADLGDWRGVTLARMRALILAAVPGMAEEWKWNVPVWSLGGIVCTGETYKKVVKLTFAKGAQVPDPTRLFNSSLEGNTRRAIDIAEGESVNALAFKALVKAAAAVNLAAAQKPAKQGVKQMAGKAPVKVAKQATKEAAKKAAKQPARSKPAKAR